jgi:hypothetical protein
MTAVESAAAVLRPRPSSGRIRAIFDLAQIREFALNLFGADLHVNRVLSLANGVAGVLNAALLSIHAIGQAYAKVAQITPKAAVKMMDRLLSNKGIQLDLCFPLWAQFVVGDRTELVLALDWTDFDDDDHTTLAVYLVTRHGRATPLYWRTYKKSELAGRRTAIEHEVVVRLDQALAPGIQVVLLADRGFGDQKLYDLLKELAWDYIIRFRGNILVTSVDGEVHTAAQWAARTKRPRMMRNARVTQDRCLVPAVVTVHDRRMKECWCLATSRADYTAAQVVQFYGRRFTIEETFRDVKDIHFGLGLRATHIKSADRRDRLLLLVAMAHALLTLLGAASEASGMDRLLKVNTVKRRTHSLFRQGCYWYDCIPTMREDWLLNLMTEFDRIVRQHAFFQEVFGFI